ncbi:MAG: deoxyguanosinetriphosphate triphosphohydrolase [Candidatus Midichloria sp.]|nr:MAG: deoxyguanosinetriphosphate triphosphohydrolase [Candidatus Midichloria sp.]
MDVSKYASNPVDSLGRSHKEEENLKLIFLNDKNRIIFSASFRRLEYKTQVFVNHSGDHYRTRLTHSLEVAAVAKLIARSLQLNEDLAEVIALSHDLGHPPFGHAGEDGLAEAMQDLGGFDHNFHTLKVVAQLEKGIFFENGLNLCYEIIEGLAKHNGPLNLKSEFAKKVSKLFAKFNLQLDKYPTLEAQVASLADDIAYCAHDIDDGLRAGFVSFEELMQVSIIKIAAGTKSFDKNNYQYLINNIREIMINDLLIETKKRITDNPFYNIQSIREHSDWVVAFSSEMEQQKNKIKNFLMNNVYKNYNINRMRYKAKTLMHDLFYYFMEEPSCLPTNWNKKITNTDSKERAMIIGDYIAGMTDRFAIDEHKRIFDPNILNKIYN